MYAKTLAICSKPVEGGACGWRHSFYANAKGVQRRGCDVSIAAVEAQQCDLMSGCVQAMNQAIVAQCAALVGRVGQ